MLGFLQNFVAQRANPIGIDLGTDCLRLAQVQSLSAAGAAARKGESGHRLVAAGSCDVPPHVRADLAARLSFYTQALREVLSAGGFRGRRAVLALPAAWMHVLHLRTPRMSDEDLAQALPHELHGKLPFDPSQALVRHMRVGEVFSGSEAMQEVLVLATPTARITRLLDATAAARVEVEAINIEPQAILNCFSHVYQRQGDSDAVNCFVDIGSAGTRAVITQGHRIVFARTISVGGDHFSGAVSKEMQISLEDARTLRIKLAHVQPALDEHRERQVIAPAPSSAAAPAGAPGELARPADEGAEDGFALLNAGLRAAQRATDAPPAPASPPAPAPVEREPDATQIQAAQVDEACREPLGRLIQELDLCRRYYESTFPNKPVERLVFVGGEAHQRTLCQHVARRLGLAAQVGDPLVRMGRISDVGIESGIDRRKPQPAWAVAIGLSMEPFEAAAGAAPAERSAAAPAAGS